jgi:AraC-like DNA-binding protein
MTLETVDMALRWSSGSVLVVLAVTLLREWCRSPAGWTGVALALTVICHLICPWAVARWGLSLVSLPVLVGCLSVPMAFRLFARAVFDEPFRFRASDAVLATALLSAGLVALHLGTSALATPSVGHFLVALAAKLLALAIVVWTLIEAHAGRGGDLVEPRRRLRLQTIAVMGAYILAVVGAELYLRGEQAPAWLSAAHAGGVLVLAFGLSLALLRLRSDVAPRPGPADAALSQEEQELVERVQRSMEQERLYRQEGLTIADLAGRLGVQEYRLRRAINRHLRFRNFNEFLNQQRIRAACAVLSDPARTDVPILTIALEQGFGSIGPFNRAFKAQIGVTPSEYRRARLAAARANAPMSG